MRTTIDVAGRLVIPKPLRDELGLAAGTEVQITSRDGSVVIEPVAQEFKVAKKGSFAVIEAPLGTPRLTQRQVNNTIRKIRERRG